MLCFLGGFVCFYVLFFVDVAHFGERLNTVIHSFGITVDKQLNCVRLSKSKACSK